MLNEVLRKAYLNYVNNYISRKAYAIDNGLSPSQAEEILYIGYDLQELYVKENENDT